MANDTTTTRRAAEAALRANPARTELPVSTGVPFWDLMLSFGKASQQALTSYGAAADRPGLADRNGYQAYNANHAASDVEVIPVGEETLHVGTRRVPGETTRIRRVVVETPVEQSVALREERVIVERRAPTGATVNSTQGLFAETTVEMSDSYEVVEVWKSTRVTEEVVLRREVTERTETVRDTVRHDEVVVEQARPRLDQTRHETEVSRYDRTDAAPQPAPMPDPAKMSADLKKVAERFEPEASPTAKAPAKAEAPKATAEAPKATAEAPKAAAETPKPSAGARAEANHDQNEKPIANRKN